MKRRYLALLVGCLAAVGACDKFLDVNTNPNAPQSVTANLYLPPMIHWMVTAPQYDGRFVGRYTQQWFLASTVLSTWDRMGYDPLSDNGAEQWRDVYWSLGQNLVDMNTKAAAEQRWDLLGVGLVLKAWGWQSLVDLHGPIIIKEAFDQSRLTFDYDSEQYAYDTIKRELDSAITLLGRSDGAVDPVYLSKGDHLYNGDRTKWQKLAYGLLAINLNHYSNKSIYSPDSVIAAVDKSFASNADDALFAYPAQDPGCADCNFLGQRRGNVNSYRQTLFVLHLMDGTDFGGVVDPRMSRMLSPSPDSVYRGLDPNVVGFGALTTTQRPNDFFGYPGTAGAGLPSRYIFSDKSKIPVVTYSELQFIKAEAAFRKGDKATAYQAYINGISSHFDFVNARNQDDGQTPKPISSSEKSTYLASAAVAQDPASLTLSQIMTQKYIALWGWGHNELWMDMRRYHYTDNDPTTGTEVYPGFSIPASLYPDNNGKPVYRIRPRYNSEYVWNKTGLQGISALGAPYDASGLGGLALDYQTVPLWILLP